MTPYIPPNSQKLSDIEIPQIRLALQGESGTGKTFSAMTFPNIVVADIDNLLTAHLHRSDVVRIPFYDDRWIRDNVKKDADGKSVNFTNVKHPQRDGIKHWLQTEAVKMEKGQTLFVDGWTRLQDYFDMQTKLEPVLTVTGGIDARVFWSLKQDYAREILETLSSLKCHVVVSFHEQDQKDELGNRVGKIIPLMQGGFVKKLGAFFSDWFQCVAESKFDPNDKKKIIGTNYFWRTKSTSEVNLKSRLQLDPLVEPHFNTLSKYFVK